MEVQRKYLRIKEACAYIGIAKSTFWLWRRQGRLPEGTLISPRVRVWTTKELDRFMTQHMQGEGVEHAGQ